VTAGTEVNARVISDTLPLISVSQASLANSDHDAPPISYDRQERELLGDYQAGQFEERMVRAHPEVMAQLRQLAAAENRS